MATNYQTLQRELTSNSKRYIKSKINIFCEAINLIDHELLVLKSKLDEIQNQFDYGRVTISFGKTSPKFLIYQKPYPKKDYNGNVIKLENGKYKLTWSKTYCDSHINLFLKNKFHFNFNAEKIRPLIDRADILIKERKTLLKIFEYNFDNLNSLFMGKKYD